jgi:glycosyltransferase involved in cell wall biosynthesis
MPVDLIVPAHNEAPRIAPVLEAISRSPAVGSIIVVCDACTDGTEEVASQFATHLITTPAHDKGTAMATGLAAVTTPLVAFMDADLRGVTPEAVTLLLSHPPLKGQLVGLRSGYPQAFGALPSLSGERRVPTELARSVPLIGSGWKAEMLINVAVARAGLPWGHVVLPGVDNLAKFKVAEHPLAWLWEQAQLASAMITYLPELLLYIGRSQGSVSGGSNS